MHTALDAIQQTEQQMRSAAFLSWHVCNNSKFSADARASFRERGWRMYEDLVSTKSTTMLASDAGIMGQPLSVAFIGEVDQQSLIGKIEGAVRVPLTSTARIQVGTITAVAVAEAADKPIMRLDFDVPTGAPTKVVAQIVISLELLRAVGLPTQLGVSRILSAATTRATDVAFISGILGDTPATVGGVGDLLAAISGGAPAKPYIIGGFDTLVPIAGELDGLRSLGVTILASPACAGMLVAVDGTAVMVADDGGAAIQVATHATVTLQSGSPPVESTVSLWAANLAAVRSERWVKYAVRSGVVAWANEEPS